MSRRWFYNLHFDGDADNIDSFLFDISSDETDFDFNSLIDKKSQLTDEHYEYMENQYLCDRYNDAYNHVDFNGEEYECRVAWGTNSNVIDFAFDGDKDIYFTYEGYDSFEKTKVFEKIKELAEQRDLSVSCSDMSRSHSDFWHKHAYDLDLCQSFIDYTHEFVNGEQETCYDIRLSTVCDSMNIKEVSDTFHDDGDVFEVNEFEVPLGHNQSVYFLVDDRKNGGYGASLTRTWSFADCDYFDVWGNSKSADKVRYGRSGVSFKKSYDASDFEMIPFAEAVDKVKLRSKEIRYWKSCKEMDSDAEFLLLSEKQQKFIRSAEMFSVYRLDQVNFDDVLMFNRFRHKYWDVEESVNVANEHMDRFLEKVKSLGFMNDIVRKSDSSSKVHAFVYCLFSDNHDKEFEQFENKLLQLSSDMNSLGFMKSDNGVSSANLGSFSDGSSQVNFTLDRDTYTSPFVYVSGFFLNDSSFDKIKQVVFHSAVFKDLEVYNGMDYDDHRVDKLGVNIGDMVQDTICKSVNKNSVELDMSEIDKKFKDRVNGKVTGKGSR